MDAWKNDPYGMPILADATYRCPCGGSAYMDSFWGGPAYAKHWHYAIKCRMPRCERHEVRTRDWRDTPAEAIGAWNRRCFGVSE